MFPYGLCIRGSESLVYIITDFLGFLPFHSSFPSTSLSFSSVQALDVLVRYR